MTLVRYVREPGTCLVRRPGKAPDSRGSIQLLLGARLHIDDSTTVGDWVNATSVPDEKGKTKSGFVELSRLSASQQLKIFYLDVGQGDATLIEAENAVVVIDGGPNSGFYSELVKRLRGRQRAEVAAGRSKPQQLHINAIIVSHFDLDHYQGLTRLLSSNKFTVGTVYHNGLPRYGQSADKDLNLGSLQLQSDGSHSISTDLHDIASARRLLASGMLQTKSGNPNRFAKFLQSLIAAHDAGRLGQMQRLVRRDTALPHPLLPDTGPALSFEVLAPLTTGQNGAIRLVAFPDPHEVSPTNPHPAPSESHTINGNSIVLRLVYGEATFLFGGDLNQPAQAWLRKRYGETGVFHAAVNKACHHGSSDFDLAYLQAVAPEATVFSSGDNGSHDHPLPDAMGAAAKHSRGDFPLVFSTELARETSANNIRFGHINARSNGEVTVLAQKKEKPSLKKTWHAFQLPYTGPFAGQHGIDGTS